MELCRNLFGSCFSARVVDYPGAGSAVAIGEQGAGATALCVEVLPSSGESWSGAFFAPDPMRPATTHVYGTPDPNGLCVVYRGSVFLGDARVPESFHRVSIAGPVVDSTAVPESRILVLATPWHVFAIGRGGILWRSARLAIDGIALEEAAQGLLRGTADSDTLGASGFEIVLDTGEVVVGGGRFRPGE